MGELRLPSVSDVSMVHEHDWTGPTIPATSEADAMHALFVLRADQFEGCTEGSPEEAEGRLFEGHRLARAELVVHADPRHNLAQVEMRRVAEPGRNCPLRRHV